VVKIPESQRDLFGMFLVVLALSLGVFYAYNGYLHNRTNTVEHLACLKDQQLAANQRRVILAVLDLARVEQSAHERVDLATIEEVRLAFDKVPQFDCK